MRAIGLLALAGWAMASAAADAKQAALGWASIKAGQARMRTGPGRNYPANWLYQRAGLPVKVIDRYADKYGEWRKIEDPDGASGWMQANLLSDTRTGYVTETVATLRDVGSPTGKVLWRAAPGVVGRVSRCRQGWCWFEVKGRGGFVEAAHLWGVDPGEELP